jgi:hypothetical protein
VVVEAAGMQSGLHRAPSYTRWKPAGRSRQRRTRCKLAAAFANFTDCQQGAGGGGANAARRDSPTVDTVTANIHTFVEQPTKFEQPFHHHLHHTPGSSHTHTTSFEETRDNSVSSVACRAGVLAAANIVSCRLANTAA